MMTGLLILALLAPAVLLAWRGHLDATARLDPSPVTAALDSRAATLVVGALTTLLYWWIAGYVTPAARVHDEASYILQAQTFALFRWTNPAPPIPAFFEQYHVFVEPGFFSKYPPGHALLMVPGVWLGLPILVPMLLHGVAGALVFALGRRLGNAWTGMLGWVLWLGATANLEFRPSYYSEATSSALWLAGWGALLEWRTTRRGRWLLLLAACTGWMAITRPLTAAAYAVPVGIVCLVDIVRHRLWRDAAVAFVLGTAIVAIMPLWSLRTIGQVRPTPYSLYSDIYFPYDKPGFGLDSSPPRRPLTRDMERYQLGMRQVHVGYEPSVLPSEFVGRTRAVWRESVRIAPVVLTGLAVVGVVAAGAPGVFALLSLVALTAAYLAFAHPRHWTVYYVEVETIAPMLAALGVGAIVAAARSRRWRPDRATLAESPLPMALASVLVALPAAVELAGTAPEVRGYHVAKQHYFLRVQEVVAQRPGERKIVFVRYAANHDPHSSLVANEADLATAPVWWVYDRGPAENARLMALAQDRVPYVLDEARGWVGPPERASPLEGSEQAAR